MLRGIHIPPLLLIVLAFIFLVNLIPFLIFLDYRRRLLLYRKVQQGQINYDGKETSSELFDDEEQQQTSPTSLSKHENDDVSKIEAMESGVTTIESAQLFVENQEQLLRAARSRWGSRLKGYNVVKAVPLNDS